jgi:hypothetical protein
MSQAHKFPQIQAIKDGRYHDFPWLLSSAFNATVVFDNVIFEDQTTDQSNWICNCVLNLEQHTSADAQKNQTMKK